MFVSRVWTLCSIFCLALAQTQTPSPSFVYPAEGANPSFITINHIDTIVVEWTPNSSLVYLRLYCNVGSADSTNYQKWLNFSIDGSTTTKLVSLEYLRPDWARPYKCHFNIGYEDKDGTGSNGPNFNISSVANQLSSTYSLSPTSLSSIASLNAPTSSATPTSTTNQPTSSSNDENRLSVGAKAGIAIGAVAGCMVLAALAFTIWRYKRKLNRLQSGHPDVHRDEMTQKDVHQHQAAADHEPQATAELEARDAPQELHGSDVIVGHLTPR